MLKISIAALSVTLLLATMPGATSAHQKPELPNLEQPTAPQPTPEETTLTQVGQQAPDFTISMLDGKEFTLSEQKNKVVLINWFATWCPPCQAEMPHLQKEVWEKFGPRGLVLVSVAREEKAAVVVPFVKKYEVTWPFGLDPERKAYAKYAEAYIPRNTLVGPDGKIIFQSEGFEDADFKAMISAIDKALTAQ